MLKTVLVQCYKTDISFLNIDYEIFESLLGGNFGHVTKIALSKTKKIDF